MDENIYRNNEEKNNEMLQKQNISVHEHNTSVSLVSIFYETKY